MDKIITFREESAVSKSSPTLLMNWFCWEHHFSNPWIQRSFDHVNTCTMSFFPTIATGKLGVFMSGFSPMSKRMRGNFPGAGREEQDAGAF